MKLPGNYVDHPTLGLIPTNQLPTRPRYMDHPNLGLVRVPHTVELNGETYYYDPALGGWLSKKWKQIKKRVSKIVPKELKGGIEKPLALAAGGYGLATLAAGGGLAAGAAKVGSAVAKTAGAVGGALKVAAPKIASGAVTAVKTIAPVISAGAKTAGTVVTHVAEAAPALLQAQQALEQQKAQAEINRIEQMAALEAQKAQLENERALMDIARVQAQTSMPPQAIVYPGAGGPPPAMNIALPGAAPAPGGLKIDTNMALLIGAGVLGVALLAGRK